ncbi:MAG: class I SAM-dependent methyltransferase [Candidatus Micrarchaeia archaeon]
MARSQPSILSAYRKHLAQVERDYPSIQHVPYVGQDRWVGNWTRYTPRKPKDVHKIIAALRTVYGHVPVGKRKAVRVLVLAGGYGHLSDIFEKEGFDAHLVDLNTEKTLEVGKGSGLKGELVAADAFSLPYKARTFDVVVSDHFYDSKFFNQAYRDDDPLDKARIAGTNAKNDGKILDEIRRVAKNNAVLIANRSSRRPVAANELLRDSYPAGYSILGNNQIRVLALGDCEKQRRRIMNGLQSASNTPEAQMLARHDRRR